MSEKKNTNPSPPTNSKKQSAPRRNPSVSPILRLLIGVVLFSGLIAFAVVAGALAGYQSGTQSQNATATMLSASSLGEQFELALSDMNEGRYEVAYQRLEYVIAQDPSYPGVTEKMAEVMTILFATATPTPPLATGTPTPTRDLRPVEEMFKHAQGLLTEQKWTETIETLVTLRKEDPAYQTARVDGMLFISLRQRGVDKIWKEGNLEGGIYDLALAARFSPLDSQADSAREMARLYLFGSSFWEVYPEQAVFYFSQVAAAAPGLRDASGWTASQRYREALIQYGDQLMTKQTWCEAQKQYELALSMGADATLEEKTRNATLQCSPPSETPTSTGETPTPTSPFDATPTPTATFGVPPTATNTPPIAPPTDTLTPPTDTLSPPTETTAPPTATDVIPPAPTDTSPAPEVTTPPG